MKILDHDAWVLQSLLSYTTTIGEKRRLRLRESHAPPGKGHVLVVRDQIFIILT